MVTNNSNELTDSWNRFILEGDLKALSVVYFGYYDHLFSYGLKRTCDKQVVEDSIQNIFLNFIRYRKNIGNVKNVTGYLTISFRHQLLLDLGQRKKLVLTDYFRDEHFEYFKNSGQEVAEKENLEIVYAMIRECVQNLTGKQQEIIYLRFEQGISYEEISAMLNISVDSCYKAVYRSVQTIRAQVERAFRSKGNLVLFFLSKLKF